VSKNYLWSIEKTQSNAMMTIEHKTVSVFFWVNKWFQESLNLCCPHLNKANEGILSVENYHHMNFFFLFNSNLHNDYAQASYYT